MAPPPPRAATARWTIPSRSPSTTTPATSTSPTATTSASTSTTASAPSSAPSAGTSTRPKRRTEYEVCPAADICQSGEAGEGIGQIGTGSTGEAWGIAVSPPDGEAANGTVFVADTTNERVNTYDLDGTSPGSFGSAAQFGSSQPRSIAVDSRGIVYATNSPDYIERYDTENANGEGVGFLAPLTEREQESQTVSFLSFNGGDQFTLTCPSGETTAPITMPAGLNNTQLGQAMEAALTAKCGGDYFTTGPIENRTVYFIGSFEGTNVPQMTCTTVSGKGTCFVSAETDGFPGALLPGTGSTATDGLGVDPDLDGGGPEEDILYILRDPRGIRTAPPGWSRSGRSTTPA